MPNLSRLILLLLILIPGCTPKDDSSHRSDQRADTLPTRHDTEVTPAPVPPTEQTDSAATGEDSAIAVIVDYYTAINTHKYKRAYGHWENDGAASGQTFSAFTNGFAKTASVAVDIATPGRIEGAAGSRYIEIPVTISAVTTSGQRQRFRGTYTLRRAVVDGATEQQQRWHIYSAHIVPED